MHYILERLFLVLVHYFFFGQLPTSVWDQKINHTIVKPNCLNIWHSRTSCINTFLTFWHTSAAAVSYSTTKYILHTEAWRAFLSHYFKYAVPVNCLSNTGVYSSTEEQVNVCCLSRKKAKRRHKNGLTGFISDTLSQFHSYLCFLTKNYFWNVSVQQVLDYHHAHN